jgi:hypothetical protein
VVRVRPRGNVPLGPTWQAVRAQPWIKRLTVEPEGLGQNLRIQVGNPTKAEELLLPLLLAEGLVVQEFRQNVLSLETAVLGMLEVKR